MDYSLPGSSVGGISQAKILKWVAIFLLHGIVQIRDRTRISCIGRRILYHWATRGALLSQLIHTLNCLLVWEGRLWPLSIEDAQSLGQWGWGWDLQRVRVTTEFRATLSTGESPVKPGGGTIFKHFWKFRQLLCSLSLGWCWDPGERRLMTYLQW